MDGFAVAIARAANTIRKVPKIKTGKCTNGSALGFEATLWATADKLRGNLDAAEYKHVVLGLIFMKYISDAFEERHAELQKEKGADAEDRDEYTADNIFWVPPEARWSFIQGRAKRPTIGKDLDDAMIAIERDNPSLLRAGGLPAPRLRQAGGKAKGDISIFGQESNPTTWRLARMNLAIRSIEGNLGLEPADSFHRDLHKDLKADYILANPPFNMSDWGGDRLRDDVRWKYGVPPVGNANYAWVQHFLHHLAPTGIAGFVLANGSMSSNQSGEGEIRKAIIEADLVDCMVALPGQLFYSTQIPVCVWFLARDKSGLGSARASRAVSDASSETSGSLTRASKTTRGGAGAPLKERRGKVLFLDARKMGRMTDRVHRELTGEDIQKIAGTYHAWRRYSQIINRKSEIVNYADIPGFCKSATLDDVRAHGHVLTPGRYVGAADIEEDGEPFEQKVKRLTATLEEQFSESAKLEKAIRGNLKALKL